MGANRIQQAIADKQEAARHHEAMYLAVGRTLRVAQEFEQNARFVTWAARAHVNVQKATEDGVSVLWQVLTSTSLKGAGTGFGGQVVDCGVCGTVRFWIQLWRGGGELA